MAIFSVTVSAYNANAPYSSNDTVTLADTGANIAALSAADFGDLAANGIDKINATDNVLSLTVAQYRALGTVTLAAGDVVTLADTGANIATLSATDMAALADAGIDKIDASDNALNLTVAQYQALGTVALTSSDTVTLVDTGTTLSALTASQIAALAAAGVDQLDASNNVLSLTLAQYEALGSVTVAANDVLTLSGTGASIGALSVAQIAGLAAAGFDRINATDDVLTLSVAQFQALGTVELAAGDVVTLADSGAAIAALSAQDIAALADAGIDKIDATDNVLSLTVAQFQGLGTVELASGDVVTLADTGTAIAALSASAIAELGTLGVDRINASDNTLSLTVAQAQALGSVALTASDTVTLADTGAHLAALTTGQIAALASAGFDVIDATDGSLTLSLAQIDALGTMALTAGNTVTAQGTVAEIEALTPAQLAALATAGVDLLGPTNGEPMLSVAQGQALLANNLWLTGNTAVLADTGAAIAAVSGIALEDLYLHGVTRIDATDDVLALSVDQALAVDQSGTALTAADLVTMADDGTTLAALSTGAIGDLALLGVDRIDASDDTLSLTVAQFQALGSITLTQADSVTLADTASNLQALSAVQIAALAGAGIDTIHATGGTLTLTTAQALALGDVALVGSDTIVLSDTAAHLEALSAVEIAALATAGIDRVEASDGSLTLSVAQAQALGTIALTPANTVTLADTGAHVAALSATDLAALATAGIDAIDASDNALNLTVAQAEALADVTLTAGDTIILADIGANLAALGTAALADLATRGFDGIDASDNVLTLSLDQVQALGSVTLAAGDMVTVVATGAQFAALTAQDFADLAAAGVDALATTDHVLSLTVAQIQALGGLALASDDTITLADSSATIAGLSATALADIVAQGVDLVSFTDQSGEFDAEHALALTGATLAVGSTLTVLDDAITLQALSPAQWAALAAIGAHTFATNSQTLTLDTAQALAIGDMVPANGNTLVIEDAGAAISDLTPAQLAAFAGKGSVVIHVQDDGLVFTKAQIDASFGIQLVDDNGATLADSASVLNGLTPNQIATLLVYPFTAVGVTQGTLAWTWNQLDALGNATITAASDATLITSQTELDGASAQTLAGLSAHGIDTLASDTGMLQVSLDQLGALGNVVLAAGDTVILADSGAALAALSLIDLSDLAGRGIDIVAVTDGALSLSLQQIDALGSVQVSAQALFTVADSGAHLGMLSVAMIEALHDLGVDAIDATDNQITLGLDAFRALDGIAFNASDSLVLEDDAAALSTLTQADLARLIDAGVSLVVADNLPMVVKVEQYAALHVLDVSGAGYVVADTGAALAMLLATQLTAAVQDGVHQIDATDDVLTLSYAQFTALQSHIALTAGDTVTLVLSASQLGALAPADLADLAASGIDVLAGNGALVTLSLAQYQALDGMTLAQASDFALALTPVELAAMTPAEIMGLAAHGIDTITLGNASPSLTLAQTLALVDVNLQAGAIVVSDSAMHLAGLSPSDIATLDMLGVSEIHVSSGTLAFNLAGFEALRLADIALTSVDEVTLADSAASLRSLTREAIDTLAAQGVTMLHATDGELALPVEAWSRLVQDGIGFTPGEPVVLADAGSALSVLAEETLATFAQTGVTRIDATDDHLTLSFTQFQALGSVALTQADTVTLWFNGDALSMLTTQDIAALVTAGVDQVGTLGEPLYVDLATLGHLAAGGLAIDPDVTVRATVSAEEIGALTPSDFAALQAQGVDLLQVFGPLSLSVAQYAALGTMELAGYDGRAVVDTGANIAALSPEALASLAALGVGLVDATDGTLHLSLAQVSAMGGMYVAYQDLAVVDLTARQAASLDNQTRALLGQHGIDAIAITEGTLTLRLADLSRYADYTFVGGNVVLAETGATLAGLAPSELAWLSGRGISAIDAQDDTLTLSLAQFTALGDMHLTMADDVIITASAAELATLSPAVFAAMDANGVDTVEISDGALNLTAAQAAQLGNVQLISSGSITLVDTGAAIAALNVDAIAGLAGSGVTGIDVTTGITINASKYEALGGIRFALSDVVTVASNHSFTMGVDVDNVTLTGTKNLVVTGNSGANVITGNAGRNTLDGGAGNDRLIGGAGRDVMSGGAGADKFIFRDGDFGGNTASTASTADRITDFSHGSKDLISLIGVDANTNTLGDDAFTWIGDSAFHHVAGELRFIQTANNTYVQGDTNGDGLSDFWIRLDGVINLQAGDFQL